VVTPVFNGAAYLSECIESVLTQTYSDFEYVIVDNCSTDDTLDIARAYAEKDERIRLVESAEYIGQIANHNRALQHIAEKSIYCKMLAADDLLLPRCLQDMVALAESDNGIGAVGAYTVLDWETHSSVYLTGLPYRQRVYSGREVCRKFMLDGTYVFGAPTATLLRSEIVRSRKPFYPEKSATADVDIFFEILRSWNFGFVPEVLTYIRRSNVSTISTIKPGLHELAQLVALEKYGQEFLQGAELVRSRERVRKVYDRILGESVLRGRPSSYWETHRRGLETVGQRLGVARLAWCTTLAALDLLLNPKATLERLTRHAPTWLPRDRTK